MRQRLSQPNRGGERNRQGRKQHLAIAKTYVGGPMSGRRKRISESARESIRSAKGILRELKDLLDALVPLLVAIWGLLHVAHVLFVLAR